MVGGQANLGLVATEVERPRLWVAEREGVSEPAGEARKVAGRMSRWREQVKRRGGVPVLWLGLLIGLESAVSDSLQRLGS